MCWVNGILTKKVKELKLPLIERPKTVKKFNIKRSQGN